MHQPGEIVRGLDRNGRSNWTPRLAPNPPGTELLRARIPGARAISAAVFNTLSPPLPLPFSCLATSQAVSFLSSPGARVGPAETHIRSSARPSAEQDASSAAGKALGTNPPAGPSGTGAQRRDRKRKTESEGAGRSKAPPAAVAAGEAPEPEQPQPNDQPPAPPDFWRSLVFDIVQGQLVSKEGVPLSSLRRRKGATLLQGRDALPSFVYIKSNVYAEPGLRPKCVCAFGWWWPW